MKHYTSHNPKRELLIGSVPDNTIITERKVTSYIDIQ